MPLRPPEQKERKPQAPRGLSWRRKTSTETKKAGSGAGLSASLCASGWLLPPWLAFGGNSQVPWLDWVL